MHLGAHHLHPRRARARHGIDLGGDRGFDLLRRQRRGPDAADLGLADGDLTPNPIDRAQHVLVFARPP